MDEYSNKYRENPTWINLLRDSTVPTQEKVLRTGAGLASLFAGPIGTAALYSPEAEAALVPASVIEARLARRATRAGVSPDKLLRRKQLVHDGKDWNRYIFDDLDKDRILYAMREDPTNRGLLRNFWKHDSDDPRLRAIGGTQVEFNPALADQGQFTPSGSSYMNGNIEVNPNNTFNSVKNTVRHEGQHALDNFLGRSDGASPDFDFDTYSHNIGEVRGRLNGLLGGLFEGTPIPGKTINPLKYEGLKDAFMEGVARNTTDPIAVRSSTLKKYKLNED